MRVTKCKSALGFSLGLNLIFTNIFLGEAFWKDWSSDSDDDEEDSEFALFTVDDVDYLVEQDGVGEPTDWYNTFLQCFSDSDDQLYMADFPTSSEWDGVKSNLDTGEAYWIGLVFIGDKGWWANGKEFKASDVESGLWLGTTPLSSMLTTPECTKAKRQGNSWKWRMASCSEEYLAICRSKVDSSEIPFILKNSNMFAFAREVLGTADDGETFCQSHGAYAAVLDDSDKNEDVYKRFQSYSNVAGTQYYIGLTGSAASRHWSDSTSVSYEAFASSDEQDSDDKCVVMDATATTAAKSWFSMPCSTNANILCTVPNGDFVKFRDKYYNFVMDSTKFIQAESKCKALDGHLVTVTDPGLHAFLYTVVNNLDNSNSKWWIGLSDRQQTGTWAWESGASLGYEQWQNSDSSADGNCVALSSNYQFQWYSHDSCSSQKCYYICESDTVEPVTITTSSATTTTATTTTTAVTTSETVTRISAAVTTTVSDSTATITTPASTTALPATALASTTAGNSNTDYCSDNPCIHGSCSNGTDDFICSCDGEYDGKLCDRRLANHYNLGSDLTYDSSVEFCQNNNASLCTVSEICSTGTPIITGVLNGDHWVPVRDRHNEWVQIGNEVIHGNTPCDVHGVRLNVLPTWGLLSDSHLFRGNVFCCKSPQHYFLGTSITYASGKDFCHSKGFKLCSKNEVCSTGVPIVTGVLPGDEWVPIRDAENDWIQIGSDNGRTCWVHNERYGIPTWGTSGTMELKGNLLCCNKNECDSDPCVHGTCSDEFNDFNCTCEVGYEGKSCDIEIDECAENPCIDGECNDELNGYTCTCHEGFEGSVCDINIDDCQSNPCVHGSCIDDIADYNCSCDAGYEGKNCDIDTDECAENPCINGECNDEINGYNCVCHEGFEGTICDINIDDCQGNPCVHGSCIDDIADYNCSCDAGFEGKNCDIDFDDCAKNPCLFGNCSDAVNNFTCSCSVGHEGRKCDQTSPLALKEFNTKRCVHVDSSTNEVFLSTTCKDNEWYIKTDGHNQAVFRHKEERCLKKDTSSDRLVLADANNANPCANFTWTDGLFAIESSCIVEDETNDFYETGVKLFVSNECDSLESHYFGLPSSCSPRDWTRWYDVSDPGAACDCETVTKINNEYPGELCENRETLQARKIDDKSLYDPTLPNVGASADTGFSCHNENGLQCVDYEVRFCCSAESLGKWLDAKNKLTFFSSTSQSNKSSESSASLTNDGNMTSPSMISNLWDSSSDQTNIGKIAFSFSSWVKISVLSIVIDDNTPLTSFYLATQSGIDTANKSTWTDMTSSFFPKSFPLTHIHSDSSTSTNKVIFFPLQPAPYAKGLIFVANDTRSNGSIAIQKLQFYTENASYDDCFMHISNAMLLGSSGDTASSEDLAKQKCLEGNPPCVGFNVVGGQYRLLFEEKGFDTNEDTIEAFINNCRDLSPYYITIAELDEKQKFLLPGYPLYGNWSFRSSNMILPAYKIPSYRIKDYMLLRGCAEKDSLPGEFYELTNESCSQSQSEVASFFVSSSELPLKAFYYKYRDDSNGGALLFAQSNDSSIMKKLNFFVEKDTPLDNDITALLLSKGYYAISSSSSMDGSTGNRARRGNLWNGWKPHVNDNQPQLDIDLKETKRLSGIGIDRCSVSSYVGDFQLLYAPTSHPSLFNHVKVGGGNSNFTVNSSLLRDEETLHFLFDETVLAQHLRFLPDKKSLPPEVKLCVKMELFGLPPPDTSSNVFPVRITKLKRINDANKEKKAIIGFMVHVSSSVADLCLALFYGDGTRRVSERGSVKNCADNFKGVTGSSWTYTVLFEDSFYFSHQFPSSGGKFNVTAAYFDSTTTITFNKSVQVDLPTHALVKNITVDNETSTEETVNITVHFSDEYFKILKICSLISFGDSNGNILLLRNMEREECESVLVLSKVNFERQKVNNGTAEVNLQYSYSNLGTFNIDAVHFDGSSVNTFQPGANYTAHIGGGCLINFLFNEDGESLTVYKSDSFVLKPYLSIECMGDSVKKSDLNFTFLWSNNDCSTLDLIKKFTSLNGLTAKFASNSLEYGCNLLRIQLSVYNSILNSTEQYIKEQAVHTVPAPLVVKIKGGQSVVASQQKDLLVDAQSSSYDPDNFKAESALTYTFEYQLIDDGPWLTLSSKGTVERPPAKLEGSQKGILKISLPSVQVSSKNITITVRVAASQGRTGTFTQTVTFVKHVPPSVEIRCVRNCQGNLVNPALSSIFEIYFFEKPMETFSYTWNVRSPSTDKNIGKAKLAGEKTRYMEILKDALSEDLYEVGCIVTSVETGGEAHVTLQITLGKPPYGGRCFAYPDSGTSLKTKFTFTCTDWAGNSGRLSHKYYFASSGQLVLLVQSSERRSPPTLLPAGSSLEDFAVSISVEVCQHDTFCASYVVNVTVYPPTSNDTSSALEEITIDGNALNVQLVGQVAAGALNKNSDTTSGDTSVIREQLVKSVENILNAVDVEQASDLAVLSDILSAATSSVDEVDDEVLASGSAILKTMGLSLVKMSSNGNSEALSEIALVTIVKGMVSSATSVLNATHPNTSSEVSQLLQPQFEQFKPEPDESLNLSPREVYYKNYQEAREQEFINSKKKKERKEIVENTMDGSKAAATAMTNVKLSIDNEPASVGNSQLDIAVITAGSSNQSVEAFNPGSSVSFSNAKIEQDIKLVTMETNPFSFDESSLLVSTGVVGLSTSGDAENDNSANIKLENKNSNSDTLVSVFLQNNQVSVSRFEVRSNDSATLMYAAPIRETSAVKVWIRKDKQAVLADYTEDPDVKEDIADFVFDLPNENATSFLEKYKIFIPSKDMIGTGTYFFSVRFSLFNETQIRAKRSTENSTNEIEIGIFSPSCKVFDELTGAWSGTMCTATLHSTKKETTCSCLPTAETAFVAAEFFVAPNFIDFSSVFSKVDLIENGAVFFTIIGFVVLFFLIILWARRQDKRDIEKWATKMMLDNSPDDTCFYKISVVTGLGSDAGTLSNIFFVLAGESSQTTVRELEDASGKHWFQSGTVIHFVMSVPESLGSLEYLHIWHDNSGPGRSGGNWFLSQVVVQDLHTNETFFFSCEDWLAVELSDGKIERVLPVAGEENLSTYKNVFASTARNRLTDGHIWFSIFVNRSKSTFTRCQRLACALMALFLSMITNAMFYKDPSDGGEDEESFLMKIGPVVIDPKTLWISAVTVLIVLPPSLALVQIFRKTGSKKDQDEVTAISLPSMSMDVPEEKKPTKPRMLPHWFVYVGWVLFAVGVIASGFFTILYSFQWGKEKSERWLSTMMLSLVQDSAVVQPIKVLLIAALIALICRKSINLAKTWQEQNEDDVIVTPPSTSHGNRTGLPGSSDSADAGSLRGSESHSHLPTSQPAAESKLAKIRERRKLEKRAVNHFTNFILYIVYIAIIFYIAYKGHQDYHFFRKTLQIRSLMAIEDFQEVNSLDGLWQYLENSIVPSLYATHKYNGAYKRWQERVFSHDDCNYRVGPLRLRQLRVKPDFCETYKLQGQFPARPCYEDYSVFNEDTEDYSPGWMTFNETTLDDHYWEYKDSSETKAIPIIGKIALYGSGGYTAELGPNKETATSILRYLKDSLWMDRSTRAVTLEFTFYNANSNVFSTVLLIAEFLSTGGCVATAYIEPFSAIYHKLCDEWLRLYCPKTATLKSKFYFILRGHELLIRYLYQMEDAANLLIATIFAAVLTLYYIALSVIRLVKTKRKFFKRLWNYFGIVRILLFFTYGGMYFYKYQLQEDTLEAFQTNTYLFTNFQSLAALSVTLRLLIGVILFAETFQVLEYFKYQKQMRKFSIMFQQGKQLIAEFMFLFVLNLIAYALAALLIFSVLLRDYQTFVSTLQTLFAALLGNPTYDDMSQASRILGKLFYLVFNFHMTYMLLNFLIGVVDLLLHSSKDLDKTKTDGKHAYFQIALGLIYNCIRRIFHMKEKEISYFKKLYLVEKASEETCNESGRSSNERQRNRERKARRNQRNRAPNNAWVVDSVGEQQLLALRRLKALEEAVDSVDISVIEVEEDVNSYKDKKAAIILEEVDNIFDELNQDLLHL